MCLYHCLPVRLSSSVPLSVCPPDSSPVFEGQPAGRPGGQPSGHVTVVRSVLFIETTRGPSASKSSTLCHWRRVPSLVQDTPPTSSQPSPSGGRSPQRSAGHRCQPV